MRTITARRNKPEYGRRGKCAAACVVAVVVLLSALCFAACDDVVPIEDVDWRFAIRQSADGTVTLASSDMKPFYPDANLTLRVAYGKVSGYSPADGVWYMPVSTLEGIMEKDDPEIFDYNIPQRLRDIHVSGDYGRWAVTGSDGITTVPVCFLATNHTSGGNSGSPVINADGNLVGINFDRVWEGTMSDIAFDPDYCRNISLDIRYVLFIIDKLADAGHLLDEMVFVE